MTVAKIKKTEQKTYTLRGGITYVFLSILTTNIYVYRVHAVLIDSRKECWIPLNWNYSC